MIRTYLLAITFAFFFIMLLQNAVRAEVDCTEVYDYGTDEVVCAKDFEAMEYGEPVDFPETDYLFGSESSDSTYDLVEN